MTTNTSRREMERERRKREWERECVCVWVRERERKRERPQQQKNDVHIFEAKNVTKISPTAKKVSQEFLQCKGCLRFPPGCIQVWMVPRCQPSFLQLGAYKPGLVGSVLSFAAGTILWAIEVLIFTRPLVCPWSKNTFKLRKFNLFTKSEWQEHFNNLELWVLKFGCSVQFLYRPSPVYQITNFQRQSAILEQSLLQNHSGRLVIWKIT